MARVPKSGGRLALTDMVTEVTQGSSGAARAAQLYNCVFNGTTGKAVTNQRRAQSMEATQRWEARCIRKCSCVVLYALTLHCIRLRWRRCADAVDDAMKLRKLLTDRLSVNHSLSAGLGMPRGWPRSVSEGIL